MTSGVAPRETLRSPDIRELCIVGSVVAVVVVVLAAVSDRSGPALMDLTFAALWLSEVVATVGLWRTRVVLSDGEVTVVNLFRTHRIPAGAVTSVAVVAAGDRGPGSAMHPRRTNVVRVGTAEGSVSAFGLISEPWLRNRSSGVDSLDVPAAALRRHCDLHG